MAINVATIDRSFRHGLLGVALVLGLLDYWFGGQNIWFRAGFVITVAGLVGYFTNFLAIKMLFQPKQGRVLGWQGLVPKNKNQIARSLAESVQEQLLSPTIIVAYIRERRLIESGTHAVAEWIDKNLQDPDTRQHLTRLTVDLLRDRGPCTLNTGLDYAETGLKSLVRDPEAVNSAWGGIRAELKQFLHDPENRTWLADNARALLAQHIPRIADWLNRALEDYLKEKRRFGGLGLGIKNIVSFDQATIERILDRFANDPQVSDDFLEMLDALVDELQREMETPEVQQALAERLESWVEIFGNVARERLIPVAVEQLDDYLSNAENWWQIEETLVSALQWTKRQSLSLLNSNRGQAWIGRVIERAVYQLNVTNLIEEQVNNLDTDELEKMVLDNTGGNLTVIQVLGGCLGLVAGTVQVHIAFALPIGIMLAAIWVAWRVNERRNGLPSASRS